jgi:UDP-N-acetylglucosamine--N-acetylmuramyl-(pentapeptide) pyrophosphoryl-undecaprenol N-acetylglucosamine transferase
MTSADGARAPILIAGGGTGGHLFPGLALAEVLVARGERVEFVGTAAGLEARTVPQEGYRLHLVEGRQFRGAGIGRVAAGMVAGARGVRQALVLVGRLRPRLVVGVGGYASVAGVLAAGLRRVPTVLLEQNAVPGAANRVLGRIAGRICIGFAAAATYFPAARVLHTGNPVRRRIVDVRDRRHPPGGRLGVLVVGGSQGARRLNEATVAAVRRGGSAIGRIALVHQTGAAEATAVAAAYTAMGVDVRVEAFIPDMAAAWAAADLAITRAGAMTCAELTAAGVPAVLVPYPYAADDHQRHNAEALVAAGAALMVTDRDLDGERLGTLLDELAGDPARCERMVAAARAAGRPDAAERIADECLRLALAENVTLL